LYVPLAQQPNFGTTFVVVKALGDPAALARPLRAAIARIDSNVPLYNIQTFEQVRNGFLRERRFAMAMMSAFGLLTGLLAGIGMYGMLSYAVKLRTHEIGIRMALGASPAAVRSEILRGGLLHALAAVTIGAGASAVLLRAITTHVPGLQPPDARLLVVTAGAILIAVIPITWLAARRATAVDPILALRAE
jgi:ABC-type antimicrobial peptide transport system permease subunit